VFISRCFALVPLAAVIGSVPACGGEDDEPDGALVCTEPAEVPCADALIDELNLQTDPAPGLISNTADGSGWRSEIDATAGGAFVSNPDSFIYARFTDQGLTKLDIGDEEALDSMLWDIAFRRYIIRINSGDSGPSCTTATRTATGVTFDAVTALPTNLTFHADDYYTDAPDCVFINDGSGQPGAAATALSGYWSYPMCVQMTNVVYILEAKDGRHLKLQVTQYYNDTWHPICQDDPGSFNQMTDTGAAHIRVRWAFLDE
jgi:hypothetical protein